MKKDNTNLGTLYLIPTILVAETQHHVIPEKVKQILPTLSYYLVENARTARRYISSFNLDIQIDALNISTLDKKTTAQEVEELLAPLLSGNNIGIMSEAGCPGVADPGTLAVAYCHKKGIKVVPLSGPSSFLLALMASGFNGQSFTFNGYLPIDKEKRLKTIRHYESEVQKRGRTQIFMETPYRNDQLLADVLKACQDSTLLCIASNITAEDEYICTMSISDWKAQNHQIGKVPTVFILGS